jgi:hypothetical protein
MKIIKYAYFGKERIGENSFTIFQEYKEKLGKKEGF